MDKVHEIDGIAFEQGHLKIRIDGTEYAFALETISRRLLESSQTERETFEVSPSGYGIHWPLLDEDLSIDGLLGIKHAPARKQRSA
jgi:hypothetical protein